LSESEASELEANRSHVSDVEITNMWSFLDIQGQFRLYPAFDLLYSLTQQL